jgi:hypothetical protein
MGNAPTFLLSELQALLEKQVRLARDGKLQEVSSLTAKLEALLAEASSAPSLPRNSEKAEHIHRLYNELCLILTTEKSDLAGKLKKMQKGKNSLQAYHDAMA